MKKTLWIAGAACVLGLASVTVHAKGVCDIHRLGYTKTQCDECSNMSWSVSRVFPAGVCVATATPATTPPKPVPVSGAKPGAAPTVPVQPKMLCDIHHLGYTKTQCGECTNMTWSVTRVFPQGQCVSTAPPPTLTSGGGNKGPTPMPTPAAPSCTLTNWGGATLPLAAPNFSGTGVRINVCSKGYDLAKSQLHCSTGVPATAFNAPTTNVTCNKTVGAPVFNPQVTINGRPCCLN